MKIVGTLWNEPDNEIVEVDGRLFVLYGWNGEKFCDCWEVADDAGLEQVSPDKTFTLMPVYKFEADENVDIEDDEALEIVDYNWYCN